MKVLITAELFSKPLEDGINQNNRIKKMHQARPQYAYYSGFADGYQKAVRDVTAVFKQHGVDLWKE